MPDTRRSKEYASRPGVMDGVRISSGILILASVYAVSAFRISAEEALRLGLVSRVLEPGELLPKAIELVHKISSFSQPAVAKAKECVNMAEEVSLTAGLAYER